mgnify:CR=1 FL=1
MTSLRGQLSKLAAIINNRCNQPAKKKPKRQRICFKLHKKFFIHQLYIVLLCQHNNSNL